MSGCPECLRLTRRLTCCTSYHRDALRRLRARHTTDAAWASRAWAGHVREARLVLAAHVAVVHGSERAA